jgi:hypothetical protein
MAGSSSYPTWGQEDHHITEGLQGGQEMLQRFERRRDEKARILGLFRRVRGGKADDSHPISPHHAEKDAVDLSGPKNSRAVEIRRQDGKTGVLGDAFGEDLRSLVQVVISITVASRSAAL